jgi:uncharacterized protein YjbI with pentapeptide repeats
MANQQHLDLLKQGVEVWNQWRKEHSDIRPDLSEAKLISAGSYEKDLQNSNLWRRDPSRVLLTGTSREQLDEAGVRGANLSGANLSGANLSGANLSGADLSGADLSGADLSGTTLFGADCVRLDLYGANLSGADLSGADLLKSNLSEANLSGANLSGANLQWAIFSKATLDGADLSGATLSEAIFDRADLPGANLSGADLSRASLRKTNLSGADLSKASLSEVDFFRADLSRADLFRADLSEANLSGVNLSEANLTGCRVFAVSAWNARLEKTLQSGLIITHTMEPLVMVDDLEIAELIYLLLNNSKMSDIIDIISSRIVLVLGRFTPERKAVQDAIRDELRRQKYVPVLFDFDKPDCENFTETLIALARLSRFIIVELATPKSIPRELLAIIPLLDVPVQPLLSESEKPAGMFEDFKVYTWVLPPYLYKDTAGLLASMKANVIDPAERKTKESGNQY